jgi:ribosomal-protein-alanine N-acetyltransferase
VKGPVVIETERLRLREFTPDDLDDLAALLGDPVVMRFWPRPRTREESLEGLNKVPALYESRGYGLWAVDEKETGAFIGRCGLIPQTVDGREEIEVGYIIAASHWRRGFGSEAAIGIRNWAFAHLEVDRLISLINPLNVASIGVATHNGMRRVGSHLHFGEPHSVYAITREEWRARAKGLQVTDAESGS